MKVVARIILGLVAIVASLFLVEMILRLAIPEPENLAKLKSSSLFIYENKPFAVFDYGGEEFKSRVVLNSSGFRDDEFHQNKDPNVFRFAILGDSYEEALQVKLDESWPKIMAKKLEESLGKKVETYNFGVAGYGIDQEWLTLKEKVWQFKPDMVILTFSTNDVGDVFKNNLIRIDNGQIKVAGPEERAGGNFLGRLVRRTYMYHVVVKAASKSVLGKRAVNKVRTRLLGFANDDQFVLSDAQLHKSPFDIIATQANPPDEVHQSWNIVQNLIWDMKRQVDEHKAIFLITVNVSRYQVNSDEWQLLSRQYKLGPDALPYALNERAAKAAQEKQILFYDPRLDAIEWDKVNGSLYFRKDKHFNQNGHKFMGTKAAEFILKSRLITP